MKVTRRQDIMVQVDYNNFIHCNVSLMTPHQNNYAVSCEQQTRRDYRLKRLKETRRD